MRPCPGCWRPVPPSPLARVPASSACNVGHVRADGTRCGHGAIPIGFGDEERRAEQARILADDSCWDLGEPMVRYVHADRDEGKRKQPLKLFERLSESAKRQQLEAIERAESVFWDAQIGIIADEYIKKFTPIVGVPLRPVITDRDPGDEQPSSTITFSIRALPRW